LYTSNAINHECSITFRQAGYFIGSGIVEAGCKTVVGQRLKQSGMRWSRKGASHVLTVRCGLLSGWFESFWNPSQQLRTRAGFCSVILNEFCPTPSETTRTNGVAVQSKYMQVCARLADPTTVLPSASLILGASEK
jgi:hypothetical protein